MFVWDAILFFMWIVLFGIFGKVCSLPSSSHSLPPALPSRSVYLFPYGLTSDVEKGEAGTRRLEMGGGNQDVELKEQRLTT